MDWNWNGNAKWELQNLQSTSCLEEEGDMNESFNLSASDVASAKSSVSASTGSSIKEASGSSGEPFTGLKLGKRAYSEHSLGKSTTASPRCQVEGCNLDLSSAKDYHKKHRVCGSHSKCPKVVISGVERRFCQQCSRFHSLAEFDEKKRSCRRRLSDHNARRRKPKHETIQFNSTNISSSYYGGGQQLSFQSRPAVSSTWINSSNSIAKTKPKKTGIIDGMPHFPNAVNIAFNRPLPSKATSFEVLNQDLKQSLSPVNVRGALSLLSNNSWGLHEPDLTRPFNTDHSQPVGSDNLFVVQPHGLPPISSPDYWQSEQQSIDPHAKTGIAQFQEFQLFDRFYSNPMDEILKPL